jgi:hypothetical protein
VLNNNQPKNKYENLNRFGCAAITNVSFILGTYAGVRTQPNRTSNGGRMLLQHAHSYQYKSFCFTIVVK